MQQMINNENSLFDIIDDGREISFNHYINRLFELAKDCNQEVYFSEIFMPLLRMSCPKGIKVVPVFDDRKTGPKSEEKTEALKRMKIIGAPKQDGSYEVPDYIFVPISYSFENPEKPILMVETKAPNIDFDKNGNLCYVPLSIDKHKEQLIPEINSVKGSQYPNGLVILTDGIIWYFLSADTSSDIKNVINKREISFFNKIDSRYNRKDSKSYKGEIKKNSKIVDQRFIDLPLLKVETEPDEWSKLIDEIKKYLTS